MSAFTENQIEYMKERRLGRLATVDAEGRPPVVPVGFRYSPEVDSVDISGHNLGATKKFRDAGKTGKAAFVVDNVLPSWWARGDKVRGRAEVFSEGGGEIFAGFSEELIRIFPQRVVGWGLDSNAFKANSRSVN